MAKGKNSAALFEVIHSDKRSAGLLRTPKWWFKGRPRDSAPALSSEAEVVEQKADVGPTRNDPADGGQSFSPRATRAGLRVDRMRNEVTMRMRLGTAMVVTFAVLVIVGLAFVIGRHVAGGPDSASAADTSTDAIRQQAPTAGTLDVSRRVPQRQNLPTKNNLNSSNGTSRHTEIARGGDAGPTGGSSGAPFTPEARPEIVGPRVFGKNYAIVKSVPPSDLKLLQQACEYLNNAGIPTTIEKTPRVFNPGGTWMSLVSEQGFTGPSDPAYNNYLHGLETAGRKFAKLRFEPVLCKWQ